MSPGLTRIEVQEGRRLTPQQIFAATAARETSLSRLLMTYIATGLVFMLLPGTFLGVWNLFAISSRRAPNSIPAAWIQAHGHAQIFGWIGTFILGIGFYSIPKLRRLNGFALPAAWTSWVLWTSGVTLRWLAGVYQWRWRVLLPLSAALEARRVPDLLPLRFRPSARGRREKEAGRMGAGCDRRRPGADAGVIGEPGRGPVPGAARRGPRALRRIRSAHPGPSDLGIPGAFRLGFQRQMAAGILRAAPGAHPGTAGGCSGELRGRAGVPGRPDGGLGHPARGGNPYGRLRAAAFRGAGAPGEDGGRARELSHLRAHGLCLGR